MRSKRETGSAEWAIYVPCHYHRKCFRARQERKKRFDPHTIDHVVALSVISPRDRGYRLAIVAFSIRNSGARRTHDDWIVGTTTSNIRACSGAGCRSHLSQSSAMELSSTEFM